jgi:hypothetical protein
MNTFTLATPSLDCHILLLLSKSIMILIWFVTSYFHSGNTEYIRRFRNTRNRCFNLNIFDKDIADLTYSGLTLHLKEKLESHVFSDVSRVMQRALDCEN